MAAAPPIRLRERTEADIQAFLPVAERIREVDGYPRGDAPDLAAFLRSDGAHGAWVAVASATGRVVGHVVLAPRSSAPVMEVAKRATGRGEEGIGVVARLVVGPDSRGAGVGRALLATAWSAALDRGLWPVLDTLVDNHRARALYEKAGWACAGPTRTVLASGKVLEQLVYVAPAPPQPVSTTGAQGEPSR